MDNERPGEYRSWRHRLEEHGALPEVGLTDKEATWDKLYDRLRGTPRRRTLPWVWTAAACLLLALIPAAFFFREKKVSLPFSPQKMAVQPRTNSLQPQTNPLRTPTPGPERSVMISNTPEIPSTRHNTPLHPGRREYPVPAKPPVLAKNTAPVKTSAPAQPPSPAKAPAIARIPTLTSTPIILQSPVRQPLPEPAPRPDLSRSIIASTQTAPKKELRVVHINELEPLQPAPAAATTGQRLKPGRLHFNFHPEQDVLRPATTYETYQTGHPIISFNEP